MDKPQKISLGEISWLDEYVKGKLIQLGVKDASEFYSHLRSMQTEMMAHLGINAKNYSDFIERLESILPEDFVKEHDNMSNPLHELIIPEEDEIRKYLEKEVPFQCGEDFTDFNISGEFEYDVEGETAKTVVYQVNLKSGRKVFAVCGGTRLPIKEVYNQDLPDAKIASKYHIYGIALDMPNRNRETLEAFADAIGLPKEYRVGYFGKTGKEPEEDVDTGAPESAL